MDRYNVAVVGAGAVGEEMLNILEQRKFPAKEIRVLARSDREMSVGGRKYDVIKTVPEAFDGIDIALFAGTEDASKEYAWEAANRGAVVIDNSATYRMDKNVPLVIPECNPNDVDWNKGVIANPNCSTTQMLVALKPLYERSRITRIVVSTYQAVSGTGRDAITELDDQTKALSNGYSIEGCNVYPYQIAFNLLPHIGSFMDNGFTSEEWKMVEETHKIFGDPDIKVTATTVRVPVFNAHSESVYIETEDKISLEEAKALLTNAPGVKVIDECTPTAKDSKFRVYPMPIDASGKDEVFVGRLRKDPFVENGLSMWVVSDNLRKGAALNAIQIAELMIEKKLIKGR